MSTPRLLRIVLFIWLLCCSLIAAPASTLRAAAATPTTVTAAVRAFGVGGYRLTSLAKTSGDFTAQFRAALASAGTKSKAHVVYLSAGEYTITTNSSLRPADYVYVVAEAGTRVTWSGSTEGGMLRFENRKQSGGVYGGVWRGKSKGNLVTVLNSRTVQLRKLSLVDSKANGVFMKKSSVLIADVSISNAVNHGIAAYDSSQLALHRSTISGNSRHGVYVSKSSATINRVTSQRNRINGIQFADSASGTIVQSKLVNNGLSVTGSTDGKAGHGLGISGRSAAKLTSTTLSSNKVCGVSLTSKGSSVNISGGALSSNGRHGVGTTAGVKVTIKGAVIAKNRYNGVLASGSGTAVSLDQVSIEGSARYGLSVPSKGSAVIRRTAIANSGTHNVTVSGGATLRMSEDNVIRNAKQHGIAVSGKSRLILNGVGNQVINNRKNGVVLQTKGTIATMNKPVTVKKNGGNGIVVKDKAKLTWVRGSVVAQNKATGLNRYRGGVVVTKSR